MPRKNTKTKKKRTTTRRRVLRRKKSYVPMPIGGFNKSKTVKLRWCKALTMDPGSNSYASYPLRINDILHIEHQLNASAQVPPGNYSEWSSRYRDWCVVGAKLTVRFVPQATEALQQAVTPAYLGIYTGNNTSELADILTNGVANLFEQPRNNLCRYTAASTLNDGVQVVKTFSARKFFSLQNKNQLFTDVVTYGSKYDDTDPNVPAKNTNPIQICYMTPYLANIAGNNPGPQHVLLMIDFIVRFSNLFANRAQ